jgi:hypothetical protein
MSSDSKTVLLLSLKLVSIPIAGLVLAGMIGIAIAYTISDGTLRAVLTAAVRFVVMAVTAVVFWFYWRHHAGLTATGNVPEQGQLAVRPVAVASIIFVALNDSSWLTLVSLRGGTRVAVDLLLTAASFVVAYALYRRLQIVDAAEAAAGMPSPEEHS